MRICLEEKFWNRESCEISGVSRFGRATVDGEGRIWYNYNMLNKRYRFHSRGGVRYTYQNGRAIRRPKLTLVHAVNSRKRQRFAVVVSKKIAKSAVTRNRIRRRVYEAIRLARREQNFVAPKDSIFIVQSREVETMEFGELKNLVASLLSASVR